MLVWKQEQTLLFTVIYRPVQLQVNKHKETEINPLSGDFHS